uniref:Calcium-transporting ATPase n=1 Tax=Gossypium raimondii TaxID=29730 RepID=A0A0D2V4L0_GOSRA|nr:hypothetical protein B456_010G025500 [Gossypium raimondii]
MESYLNENFGDVKPKNSSEEALERWRKLCWIVKNRKRRFRFTANLSKRFEAEAIRRSNQEKFRVAVLVSQAALQFIHGLNLSSEYDAPEEVKAAGFQICADELGSIVEGHDVKKLKIHGGVEDIAAKLSTSIVNGIPTSEHLVNERKRIYGINKFTETPPRGFWVFVWEALQDTTLMILAVCALVSLAVGITVEGWPKGAYDGLGIVLSILLVVFVTATSDYRQSLQFRDLDKEKKKITVQVTRDGLRQKISIFDLLPGDIVHLAIGDQVPADGLFISGFSVLINESSLTGESEPVSVNSRNPFLLSGTKVQDGSCKMLVTTVGMRTQWGKLMATLSEGGDDETPLQVKLNGVATIIGKIGLFFAVVTFAVLVQGLFSRKLQDGTQWIWSGDDAMEMLEFFAIAVTIVVVAVPEGLPLAVTLSLAFAMKKMMNDKALVRHLAACETMGSSTSICSDKTGTNFSGDSSLPLQGYTCIGIVGIKDPVRPGVKESVAICKSAGITVRMVTGDNINTAKAIAREIGILTDDGIAIEGPVFREKSEEELYELIPKIQVMARSSPMDKHTLVKHLRTSLGEVVAVTGDGTNDAPALHEADIGLAMGIAGTEVAKESADVIILDDNFSTIVTVAKWGRSVYINIQKFVQFQLTVNVVALIVNFASACLTGNAPLTAVQLLWVNMIMDTLGALALATEPPNDDLMKRSPVGRKGNFISNVMWRNILGQSLYQFVIIWILQTRGKAAFHLDGPDSDLILNTLIFNSFVFCQVFNEISSREMEKINVLKGLLKNHVFVAVISCTIIFQIVIVEFLGTFASTSPLTVQQWFVSVCLGFLGMPIAAALKLIPVGSN